MADSATANGTGSTKGIGVYEGLFILDANKHARDPEKLPGEVNSLIEEHGGTVEVSRLWEERRLAYPINGHRKGVYWIVYFRSPTAAISEMTRAFEIRDGVLRQLFVRLPKALVNPILEHAKGGGAVEDTPTEETVAEPAGAAS